MSRSVENKELVKNGDICQAKIKRVDTNFKLNFNLVYDYSKGISELIENHDRNILIAMTVVNDSGSGVRLILSDRVQHLLLLAEILDDKGFDILATSQNLTLKI